MAIVETSTKVVKVTRDLVQHINGLQPWNGDRAIIPKIMLQLEQRHQRGLLHTFQWVTATVNSRTKYRINGKHSTTFLLSLPSIPDQFRACVMEFNVANEQELATLWSQFDSAVSARNMRQRIKANLASIKPLKDMQPDFVQSVLGGIGYSMCSGNRMKDTDAALCLLQKPEVQKFILWFHDLTSSKTLTKAPVSAAIWDTYHADETDSKVFWEQVRDASKNTVSQPANRLSHFLAESRIEKNGHHSAGKQLVTLRAVYVKCLHAWNAYRNGSVTDLKYHASAGIPQAL
jgi:hypothetical protein